MPIKNGINGEQEFINIDDATQALADATKQPIKLNGYEHEIYSDSIIYKNSNAKITETDSKITFQGKEPVEKQIDNLMKIAEKKGWDLDSIQPFGSKEFKEKMEQRIEQEKQMQQEQKTINPAQVAAEMGGIAAGVGVGGAVATEIAKSLNKAVDEVVNLATNNFDINDKNGLAQDISFDEIKEMTNGIDLIELKSALSEQSQVSKNMTKTCETLQASKQQIPIQNQHLSM